MDPERLIEQIEFILRDIDQEDMTEAEKDIFDLVTFYRDGE